MDDLKRELPQPELATWVRQDRVSASELVGRHLACVSRGTTFAQRRRHVG